MGLVKFVFREAFVRQAEPEGPEESLNTRSYPRPAPLDEYEPIVASLISGLGDCLADPRLLLASATSNFPSGNLFDMSRYRFWVQWMRTGRPDDVEDYF